MVKKRLERSISRGYETQTGGPGSNGNEQVVHIPLIC